MHTLFIILHFISGVVAPLWYIAIKHLKKILRDVLKKLSDSIGELIHCFLESTEKQNNILVHFLVDGSDLFTIHRCFPKGRVGGGFKGQVAGAVGWFAQANLQEA